jgi:hypothetical protein
MAPGNAGQRRRRPTSIGREKQLLLFVGLGPLAEGLDVSGLNLGVQARRVRGLRADHVAAGAACRRTCTKSPGPPATGPVQTSTVSES